MKTPNSKPLPFDQRRCDPANKVHDFRMEERCECGLFDQETIKTICPHGLPSARCWRCAGAELLVIENGRAVAKGSVADD